MRAVAIAAVAAAGCNVVFPLDRQPDCPETYAKEVTGTYRRIQAIGNFVEQQGHCRDDNVRAHNGFHTHMVVLSSEEERDEVHAIAPNVDLWVGYLLVDGQYRWITDEDTGGYPAANASPPWIDASEPAGRGCTLITQNDGRLATALCKTPVGETNRETICECDANPDKF